MKIAEHCFLITGAASGLGAATADRLVAAGGRVVLADISEAAREHAAALGASARFCHCDITDSASVSAALDVAEQSFGALHGVIHCAGVVSVAKLVDREGEPAPLEGFEKTLAINLSGTFQRGASRGGPHGAQCGRGEDGERGIILNTASVAAFDGQIGQCAYSASKAGVAGMTLPMARELARHGIRVMAIAPGVFETPMMAGIPEPAREALCEAVPFPKRLGRPDEFARLAEHIITNGMLNGEVIRLDGSIRMA
ncbi:SDR family NAD(P)-dependent oxidoreductase [Cobetia marina]